MLDDYVVRDNREHPLIDIPLVEMGRGQPEEFMLALLGDVRGRSLDARMIDAGSERVLVLHDQARGRRRYHRPRPGRALRFRKGQPSVSKRLDRRAKALEAAGRRG